MAKMIIRAAHTNGYVKAAFVREESEAAKLTQSLQDAGCWRDVTAEPFIPAVKKTRRAA
jgi:hypothetical protein